MKREREEKKREKKTKAPPLDERESEWKWKGSDFPQLYFILRISSRTVGCLSVAGELVTLCTVHNMKLAKLTSKLWAVNAGRFACRGFQVSFSAVGKGERREGERKEGKEGGRRKKEERRRKNLVDGMIKSRGSVKASCVVRISGRDPWFLYFAKVLLPAKKFELNARSEFLGIGNFSRV